MSLFIVPDSSGHCKGANPLDVWRAPQSFPVIIDVMTYQVAAIVRKFCSNGRRQPFEFAGKNMMSCERGEKHRFCKIISRSYLCVCKLHHVWNFWLKLPCCFSICYVHLWHNLLIGHLNPFSFAIQAVIFTVASPSCGRSSSSKSCDRGSQISSPSYFINTALSVRRSTKASILKISSALGISKAPAVSVCLCQAYVSCLSSLSPPFN